MNIPGFKEEHILGKGSYGTVYKARRLKDNTSYAVKIVNTSGMELLELQDSINEIRLIASFKSPFIVRFYEAFVQGKRLCVVTEYARLGDLSKLIDRRKRQGRSLLENDIWRFLIQVTEGLRVLHEAGVVHRDIKSANLLLCAPDVVKIGDLGVSTILRNHKLAKTQIGTPLYLAPEIWRRRPYDSKCDMWSLGVVLFEMLNFSFPFIAKTTEELGKRILAGRIGNIKNGYSSEIKEIVYALLQINPDRRPSSTELMQHIYIKKRMYLIGPVYSQIPEEEEQIDLLPTIRIPRVLKKADFPRPSYDDMVEVVKPIEERLHLKGGVVKSDVSDLNTKQLMMIADHDWWSPNKLQIQREDIDEDSHPKPPLSQRSPFVPPVLPQIMKPVIAVKPHSINDENKPQNQMNENKFKPHSPENEKWIGQVFYQKKKKRPTPPQSKAYNAAPRKSYYQPLSPL